MKNYFRISCLTLFVLVGCDEQHFKESRTFAGNKVVTSDTLNLGRSTYMEYCVQCHGPKGDGAGVASMGMNPPPRNFTTGVFKFGNVVSGEIPHDEAIHKIVRNGLHGTAMLKWDISDTRLDAVTQYIKTFAPDFWEGGDKTLGTKFEIPADPFGEGRKAEAIEKGKRAYYISASCIQCHRGYETKANISGYNKEINKVAMKPDEFAADLYQVKKQEGEMGYKVVPPDFTYHELRTVTDMPSMVERLMYGVHGSGMPGWKDVVTDEELWALAYYVQSLVDIKGNTAAREALLKSAEQ